MKIFEGKDFPFLSCELNFFEKMLKGTHFLPEDEKLKLSYLLF